MFDPFIDHTRDGLFPSSLVISDLSYNQVTTFLPPKGPPTKISITSVRTTLPPLSIAIFFISIAILPANAAVLSSRGETAASKDYIILPKDSATPNDKKAFGDKLLKSVGDKNKIYTSDVDCCGIGFWSVPLTDQQRTDLSTNDVVDAIEEDVEEKWSSVEPPTTQGRSLKYDIRDSLAKRAIVHEPTPLGEMLFISQPEHTNLVDLDFYNFDDSAGKDVSLYIIDSRANTDHPVSLLKDIQCDMILTRYTGVQRNS